MYFYIQWPKKKLRKLFYLEKQQKAAFFVTYIHCLFQTKLSPGLTFEILYPMLIKEIPLLQNICFFYSSSKCFEFTWTEGSNRNETSNTCNTGDEIPCYDPQLSTPEPPTSEEIYKPEFQQGKICDQGSGSFCIKVKKSWILWQNVLQNYFVLLVHEDFHGRSIINYPCLTVLW